MVKEIWKILNFYQNNIDSSLYKSWESEVPQILK